MHIILNFQVNQTLFYALALGDCRPLAQALRRPASTPTSANGASSCAAMMSWISGG